MIVSSWTCLLDVVVEDSEPLTEDTAEVLVAVDVTFTINKIGVN